MAGRQISTLVASGLRPARSPIALLIVAAWIFGVGGDAFTSIAMMRTGVGEEANPSAAFGMDLIGIEAYILLASALVCGPVLLLLLGAAKARSAGAALGTYGRALTVACSLFVAGKVYMATSNALLWWDLTHP